MSGEASDSATNYADWSVPVLPLPHEPAFLSQGAIREGTP
jgi:hypothetical protein